MGLTHNSTPLERAIFNTVRYFNLFDQAVTTTQIWQCLIDQGALAGQPVRLKEVQQAMAQSPWLAERLTSKWGYSVLRDREALVRLRLWRHRLAQQKWRLTRRVVRWLIYVPFVRMVALSGSLALGNTKPTSDLDLLIVAKRGHIWTARLGLLLVTQLFGRRRTHWDRQAPDKVCLNHHLTDDALLIQPAIRDIYTAVMYRHLIPAMGLPVYAAFQQQNHFWLQSNVTWPKAPVLLASRHAVVQRRLLKPLHQFLEAWLAEPSLYFVEHLARLWQRSIIERHTRPGQAGRIVITDTELAFHPDTKAPQIVAAFSRRLAQ